MQISWNDRFAQRTRSMVNSAIRELLKLTENPEVISFAGGLPAPDVFPIEKFKEASDTVLTEMGAQALQYGTTEGYQPLRDLLAKNASVHGAKFSAANVLITSGSQQALDLMGKIFINEGEHVLVENPTYLGAIQAWAAYGVKFVTVPSDEHGMETDKLEAMLQTQPKFIYVISNFQNPTGVTLTFERRIQLVKLAQQYGVPIIEDDPYGQLRYEGEALPSVLSLDAKASNDTTGYHGNVIYTSTFSKTLAPGLRLAWVIAPNAVAQKMVQAKQGTDLHTSTLNQYLAYEMIKDDWMATHIELIKEVYSERRDIMLDSLEKYMPKGIKWTHPDGGLFLWVTLPQTCSSVEIFKKAVEQKVAFVPGNSFHANGGGENTMRLNFSNSSPEKIVEGIKRLADVIQESL